MDIWLVQFSAWSSAKVTNVRASWHPEDKLWRACFWPLLFVHAEVLPPRPRFWSDEPLLRFCPFPNEMVLNPLPPILNRLRLETNYELMIWSLIFAPMLCLFFFVNWTMAEKWHQMCLLSILYFWRNFTFISFPSQSRGAGQWVFLLQVSRLIADHQTKLTTDDRLCKGFGNSCSVPHQKCSLSCNINPILGVCQKKKKKERWYITL